jgi:hypothetical protein
MLISWFREIEKFRVFYIAHFNFIGLENEEFIVVYKNEYRE